MLDLEPYLIALAGVSLLAGVTCLLWRREELLRCLLAVVAVWAAGFLYGDATGDLTHWQFNILTDGVAAVLILRHPAGKMQAALGGTYAVQVAMHLAFGARELWSKSDPLSYYEMLTIVAYAQLFLLGGWAIGTWGRAAFDRWRSLVSPLARRSRAGGVERSA